MANTLERRSTLWTLIATGLSAMLAPFGAEIPEVIARLMLAGGGIWSLSWAGYGYATRNPSALKGDMAIRDAVEYLVNGTSAKLEQNRAPYVETVGVAKGHVVVQADRPQQDALRMIEEQLALGALTAFGRRAVNHGNPSLGFEAVRRIIPKDYWEHRGLRVLFARIPDTVESQTEARGRGSPEPLSPFTDIQLNRTQVRACWKPRGLFERWVTPRISDPMFTKPTKVLVEATAVGQSSAGEGLRQPGERFMHEFRPGERLSSWMRLPSGGAESHESKTDDL